VIGTALAFYSVTVAGIFRTIAALVVGLALFGCSDGRLGANTEANSGKAIYYDYCYSCHNPGISGAPRLGDIDDWRPRIAKGKALLLASTVNGISPGMPARGLCYSCTDEALSLAVDYMIEQGRPSIEK
jgi:cytochrome c5